MGCMSDDSLRAGPPDASLLMEAQDLRDILGLVDMDVSVETICGWTAEQRALAEDWAGAVHFAAADNDNEVPPKPDFLGPSETEKRLSAYAMRQALGTASGDQKCHCGAPTPEGEHRTTAYCDSEVAAAEMRLSTRGVVVDLQVLNDLSRSV